MSDIINDVYDITFDINGYNFVMKRNNDYYYIIIDNNTDKLDWIDTINMYSITKKPSKEKLLEKIKKKLNISEKIIINSPDKKPLSQEATIYKEIDRLKALSNDNNITVNKNINKKIFNDNTIRDIIINKYIDIWKSNNNNIKINIIDNIYVWNITYLIKKNNINNINMQILFDSKYYPYAPPQIQIISPKLKNKLDHKIANCKLFKLEYWDPTIQMNYIIEKIYDILKQNAQFNTDNNKNINNNLYQKLMMLSSYVQNSDINEIDVYFSVEKSINSEKPIKKEKNKTDKFNGTGYRMGDNNWKIEDYETIQKTKEIELISILNNILDDLYKIDKNQLYDTIENSFLIKFLVETLNTTLLDISNRFNLFKICFSIIQHMCIDTMVLLLFDKNYNLFESIKKLYDSAKLSAKFNTSDSDSDNDEIITQILFVWSMIEPLKIVKDNFLSLELSLDNSHPLQEQYNILSSTKDNQINNQINNQIDDKNKIYYDNLYKLRFDTTNIVNSNYNSKYLPLLNSSKTSNQCMKRLSTEIPTLADNLPIYYDASIYLRIDENNPRSMRALITGPPDTPYDSGIFIFDIYIPPNYPTDVPMINFTNTGGKRFNPNLYNCGKVCLSILGTYVGPTASQTEKWNTSSTLYQVLLSIQGQILVENPYFNEPGYQHEYKTPNGTKKSDEYNKSIKLYTLQHAMLDLLDNNMFPEFKDIINMHFKIKKDKIIDICNKWITEYNNDNNYKVVIDKLLKQIYKL
jgi:ubiquitin-protein ligase